MPTMSGFSNVKSYYFPSVVQGALLYISKDSLVFANILDSAARGSIGWSKGFQTATPTIWGTSFSFNTPTPSAPHSGGFVPAGATISVFSAFDFTNIYLYVIELDNDEPNA